MRFTFIRAAFVALDIETQWCPRNMKYVVKNLVTDLTIIPVKISQEKILQKKNVAYLQRTFQGVHGYARQLALNRQFLVLGNVQYWTTVEICIGSPW